MLVAAQAALGAALLVATGLLVLSFVRLMGVDKGFDTAQILTIDVALPSSTFPAPSSSSASSTTCGCDSERCLAWTLSR